MHSSPEGATVRPFISKSVVIDLRFFDWKDDHPPRTPLEDTIIYGGYTPKDSQSVTQRSRLSCAERMPDWPIGLLIDHLTRLGITAVELLPVHQFIHRRPLVERALSTIGATIPPATSLPTTSTPVIITPAGRLENSKR